MAMDEILIEEKKYISSKRAAKITGYAKDYVGQLCREGRVPARLVGRSWYVLDSAIHDHRFGNVKTKDEQDEIESSRKAPVRAVAWEKPRYEADTADVLPSIHRLSEREMPVQESIVTPQAPQELQDTWKEWFDRIADTMPANAEPTEETETQQIQAAPEIHEEPQWQIPEEDAEVSVPIHTYERPPDALLPQKKGIDEGSETIPSARDTTKAISKGSSMLQSMLIVIALLSVAAAVIGSGNFDSYFSKYNQLGAIAGIQYYNK